MSWEAIAAFTMLGLSVLTSLVLVMRALWKIESNLRIYFEDKQKETKASLREEINESREMFGESVRAVREHADIAYRQINDATLKHQQLELYIRDNYVETSSFNVALARIERTIDGMDTKIDTLMSRNNGTKTS